jgi:hypothetical protein
MPLDDHPASTVWSHQPEPDVWYGPDGIDALIWADGTPYVEANADDPTAIIPDPVAL